MKIERVRVQKCSCSLHPPPWVLSPLPFPPLIKRCRCVHSMRGRGPATDGKKKKLLEELFPSCRAPSRKAGVGSLLQTLRCQSTCRRLLLISVFTIYSLSFLIFLDLNFSKAIFGAFPRRFFTLTTCQNTPKHLCGPCVLPRYTSDFDRFSHQDVFLHFFSRFSPTSICSTAMLGACSVRFCTQKTGQSNPKTPQGTPQVG